MAARPLKDALWFTALADPSDGILDALTYDEGSDTLDFPVANLTQNGSALGGGGSAFNHLTESGTTLTYDGDVHVTGDLSVDGSAPGGSAFAHLSEDTGNSQIVASWDLVLSGAALLLGDGTNPPDVTMARTDVTNLRISGLGVDPVMDFSAIQGAIFVAASADYDATYVGLRHNGLELASATHDITLTVDADGDLAVNGVKVQLQA